MKRTDSPKDTAIEGEPTIMYADSDVGSSPGLPKSSEDSLPPVRWDDSTFSRVKLMCSYGGRILPRPHDNQLRYVGGDSRIVVVPRNVTFSDLMTKLSKMFGAAVAIKYQLPCEDLDALISVTSDEDLEIMMEENDRLQQQGPRSFGAGSSSSMPRASSRLRLFLFPTKMERSQTTNLSEMLESTQSREKIFVDILNGMPPLPRVRSESSSIISENPDYLFGQDAFEEWAAAASYGAGTALSSSTAAVISSSGFEKPPDLIGHGSVGFPTLLGSHLHYHEASSAPASPLKTGHLVGGSSSAPPVVISIISDKAGAVASQDSRNFATSLPQIIVETGSMKSVQHNEMETSQEQHLSLSDTSAAVTGGSKRDSETGSVHSLPSERVLDEGITIARQAITTMPIYDEDDQHALPPAQHAEQLRVLKIDDKQDIVVEETPPVQKVALNAKLEVGTRPVYMEMPFGVSAASTHKNVASQPIIVSKVPPMLVSAATNVDAPAIVTVPQAMQKCDNAQYVQANLYQQHHLFQEGSTELVPTTYAMQGPGVQQPSILTHMPVVNPTSATVATSVGVIAPPVHVGAPKPVAVGAQQIMGGAWLGAQPILTGAAHLQLPRVVATSSPHVLDQGTIPSKVQQIPRDPSHHHFQRAVTPSVPALTSPKEILYQYATPVICQAMSPMALRFHGHPARHPALQQVPPAIPPTLQQVAPAMVSNMHGRPVTPLPQYYYVVEQPPVTVGNVYFPQDAIGAAPQPRPLNVAGSNPFMDDLHPPLPSVDPPLVGLRSGTESSLS